MAGRIKEIYQECTRDSGKGKNSIQQLYAIKCYYLELPAKASEC